MRRLMGCRRGGQLWNCYVNQSCVYGFGRVAPAAGIEEAKKVKSLDEEVGGFNLKEISASAEADDESASSREFFPEKLWWKKDGHMDGK
jgi:hypothetical protein